MSSISINGVNFSGDCIVVKNGKILVNGTDCTPDTKEITITVQGDITTLDVDYAKEIHVSGNAGSIRTTSGDVNCGNVTGNVQSTSGDIECDTVCGDVQSTSGDVSAGLISGNVRTVSGDIKHKK